MRGPSHEQCTIPLRIEDKLVTILYCCLNILSFQLSFDYQLPFRSFSCNKLHFSTAKLDLCDG